MAKDFLNNYEPVVKRIAAFYTDYKDGRILTEVLSSLDSSERVVVKATIYRTNDLQEPPASVGHASEVPGKGHVNKDNALENAETSAIGRALANLNYPAKRSDAGPITNGNSASGKETTFSVNEVRQALKDAEIPEDAVVDWASQKYEKDFEDLQYVPQAGLKRILEMATQESSALRAELLQVAG